MSAFPSTDRLRQVRERTDESCPFLFTLLGLVAVAEGVLGAAGTSDGRQNAEPCVDDANVEDGLMVALGAVALAQQLIGSCTAVVRRDGAAGTTAAEGSRSALAESEDPWCGALI
jgi:hypothetical protein